MTAGSCQGAGKCSCLCSGNLMLSSGPGSPHTAYESCVFSKQLVPHPNPACSLELMGSCLGIAPLLKGISKVTSPSVPLGAAPGFLSSSDRLGEECWLTSAASMALGQGRCRAGQLLAHRQPLKRSQPRLPHCWEEGTAPKCPWPSQATDQHKGNLTFRELWRAAGYHPPFTRFIQGPRCKRLGFNSC